MRIPSCSVSCIYKSCPCMKAWFGVLIQPRSSLTAKAHVQFVVRVRASRRLVVVAVRPRGDAGRDLAVAQIHSGSRRDAAREGGMRGKSGTVMQPNIDARHATHGQRVPFVVAILLQELSHAAHRHVEQSRAIVAHMPQGRWSPSQIISKVWGLRTLPTTTSYMHAWTG